MANSFGISFVPGAQRDQIEQQGGQPSGLSPAQSAVQMLSLRLPRVAGAQALAPGALLASPGAAGQQMGSAMSNPLLQALLRLAGLLGGPEGLPGGPAMAPMGGFTPTAPRIIPGEFDRMPGPGMMPAPGMPDDMPPYDRRDPGMGTRVATPQAPLIGGGPVDWRSFETPQTPRLLGGPVDWRRFGG